MVTWPLQLQQYLNGDSFTYTFGETVIRSEMDVGPRKVRRRSTKSIDSITGSIDMEFSDWDTLKDFYKTTTNGGSDYFIFKDPIDESDLVVRFTSPPAVTRKGGVYFTVSINLETRP
jgi:hypothetical protein